MKGTGGQDRRTEAGSLPNPQSASRIWGCRPSIHPARLAGDAFTACQLVGSVWGFFQAWIWCEGSVTADLSLTPGFAMQIYAGLIAGAVVMFVSLHFTWIKARFSCEIFREQSSLIERTMDLFANDINRPQDGGTAYLYPKTRADISELRAALDDLDIQHPPEGQVTPELAHKWGEFLPRLLASARAGKLKRARALWQDMKKERGWDVA